MTVNTVPYRDKQCDVFPSLPFQRHTLLIVKITMNSPYSSVLTAQNHAVLKKLTSHLLLWSFAFIFPAVSNHFRLTLFTVKCNSLWHRHSTIYFILQYC